MIDMEKRTFQLLTQAEAEHPGPMRLFCAELREYLEGCEKLIGKDEYVCEVCGVANVRPDGSGRVMFWGLRDRRWCDAHADSFTAAIANLTPPPPRE